MNEIKPKPVTVEFDDEQVETLAQYARLDGALMRAVGDEFELIRKEQDRLVASFMISVMAGLRRCPVPDDLAAALAERKDAYDAYHAAREKELN